MAQYGYGRRGTGGLVSTMQRAMGADDRDPEALASDLAGDDEGEGERRRRSTMRGQANETQQRMAAAELMKEQGNGYFKGGEHGQALVAYSEAISVVPDVADGAGDKETVASIVWLSAVLHCNRSMAHASLGAGREGAAAAQCWEASATDARAAVATRGDFFKARESAEREPKNQETTGAIVCRAFVQTRACASYVRRR